MRGGVIVLEGITPVKPPKTPKKRKAKFHCDFCGDKEDYEVHEVPGRGLVCKTCGRDVEVREVTKKPEAQPTKKERPPWWARFEDVISKEIVKDVDGYCQIGGAERKRRFLKIYLGTLRTYATDTKELDVLLLDAEKTLSDLEAVEADHSARVN